MTIKYYYHTKQRYILTKVSGITTLNETLEHFNNLIEDPLLNDQFVEIVDFSETINFDFGYYQTGQLADKVKQLSDLKNYLGSILIADKDFIRGMAHMFKVVAEDRLLNFKIANDCEEAETLVNEYFS